MKAEALFAQVQLDVFGAPCWPNGADIAPDAIYAELTGQPTVQRVAKTKHLHDQKPI